jgi:hypothetical protein
MEETVEDELKLDVSTDTEGSEELLHRALDGCALREGDDSWSHSWSVDRLISRLVPANTHGRSGKRETLGK